MKKYWWLYLIIVMLATVLLLFKFGGIEPKVIPVTADPNYFGVTFSKKMAEELGLNWQETYIAMLDDLKVKQVRIPIYWDEIEKNNGSFDFSDYEYILDEGAKRDVKFIMVIGYRQPRWPECHIPQWVDINNQPQFQAQVLAMLDTTVKHYLLRSEIVAWQVENEPLLGSFGICPPGDENFLKSEVALVKSIDGRPTLITASGELSSWKREGAIGDLFGTTMYRTVWGSYSGYLRYPLPAAFYTWKAKTAKIELENRIIIELQAEPWSPKVHLRFASELENAKSFNEKRFWQNINYAKRTGFDKAYLWGVEWWYFELKRGNDTYWQAAKQLF